MQAILWIKALHIIFMVMWFSGLFYLPRLFVYHAMTHDALGIARFKVMEHKLYYFITTPGGILTTLTGLWLLSENFSAYMQVGWMHFKLALIIFLWAYHLYCGYLVRIFYRDANRYNHVFYRWFNEVPTLLLFATVILVVIKPF